MAEQDSLRQIAHARTPFSTWFGVVLLFALFGLIVFAVIGPSSRTDTYESSRAKKRAENLKALREDAAKSLTSYAWVDKTKGTARIPIERAMELTMAELKTKKPGPGGPIVTAPAAASAQAPATSSSATTASPVPKGKGTPKPTSVEGPDSENRGQPAAATNPAKAPAGTQPGANATPAGSASPSSAAPAASASPMVNPATSGSPLPVRGASPPPSASPH
jgi:hypothetical protein